MIPATKLNIRWNNATLNSVSIWNASTHPMTGSLSGVNITTKNMAAPTKLKNVWNIAVCLDVRDPPKAAIHEVTHVPMFAPTTKHNALGSGKSPAAVKKTTIAVTTDDD